MPSRRNSDGNGIEIIIQQINLKVWYRPADDTAARLRYIGRFDRPVSDMNGGFGNAIHIDEAHSIIGVALKPGLKRRKVESLAAKDF